MQKTYFKNNLIEKNMFSFCFLFLIHINVYSCKPREDEEEACSKRGIGGRSALAVRTFPRAAPTHCTVHGGAAVAAWRRRLLLQCRWRGGVAAAAVSQQQQTLHCRSSLPQSDYSAPLRTQEPARFKPPKIAIATAAATPPSQHRRQCC